MPHHRPRRLCFTMVSMLMVLSLVDATFAATRVAVVITSDQPSPAETAIEAQLAVLLADENQYEQLERQQIRDILSEHKLSLAGLSDPATAVQAGNLLAVDLFVLQETLTMTTPAPTAFTRQLILECKTGIILDERLTPQAEALADPAILADGLRRAAKRQAIPHDKRRYITLATFRNEAIGQSLSTMTRGLQGLISVDLQQLDGVFLLDRRHLRLLQTENSLAPLMQAIQPATTTIEVSLAPQGDAQVRLSIAFAGAGDLATSSHIVENAVTPLRQALLAAVAKHLKQEPAGSPAMEAGAETQWLQARAESDAAHDDHEQAIPLLEAAALIDPSYRRRSRLLNGYEKLNTQYARWARQPGVEVAKLGEPPSVVLRWQTLQRSLEVEQQVTTDIMRGRTEGVTFGRGFRLGGNRDVTIIDPQERELPEYETLFVPLARHSIAISRSVMDRYAGKNADHYVAALRHVLATEYQIRNETDFLTVAAPAIEAYLAGVEAGWIAGHPRRLLELDYFIGASADGSDEDPVELKSPILAWLRGQKDPFLRLYGHRPVVEWAEQRVAIGRSTWKKQKVFLNPEQERQAIASARAVLEICLLETLDIREPRSFFPYSGQSVIRDAVAIVDDVNDWDAFLKPVLKETLERHHPVSIMPLKAFFESWLNPAKTRLVARSPELRALTRQRYQTIQELLSTIDLPKDYQTELNKLLTPYDITESAPGPDAGPWARVAMREVDFPKPADARHLATYIREGERYTLFWETNYENDDRTRRTKVGDSFVHTWIIMTTYEVGGASVEVGRFRLKDPLSPSITAAWQTSEFVTAAGADEVFILLPDEGLVRFKAGSATEIAKPLGLKPNQVHAMCVAGGRLYLGLHDKEARRASALARVDPDGSGFKLTYLISSQGVEGASGVMGDRPFIIRTMVADEKEGAIWLSAAPFIDASPQQATTWRVRTAGNPGKPIAEKRQPTDANILSSMKPIHSHSVEVGPFRLLHHRSVTRLGPPNKPAAGAPIPPLQGYNAGFMLAMNDPGGTRLRITVADVVGTIGPAAILFKAFSPSLVVVCMPEDLDKIPLPLGVDPRSRPLED